MSCSSSAFSLGFGLHRQNFKQRPCMSCHSVHWSEITSVKSPLLQMFAKHFELVIFMFILAVRLYGRLAKNQEGNLFDYSSRLVLDSCLRHGKLQAVCLQRCPQPIKHSKAGCWFNWFSPKMGSPCACLADKDWIIQTNCTRICL